MEQYLSGEKLIGDDYTLAEIEQWYKDEEKDFTKRSDEKIETFPFSYHNMNRVQAFNFFKGKKFVKALGIGSGNGDEFLPIQNQTESLCIADPSNETKRSNLLNIEPKFSRPKISGNMNYSDNEFDLAVCFGVLHHIANVSYVFKEIERCLTPGAYFVLQEPITSRGDWTKKRKGLTRHERGIPLNIFREIIAKTNFKIIKEKPCFFMNYFTQNTFGKLFKKPLIMYPAYVRMDAFFSKLFLWNYKYHPKNKFQRIGPTSVLYVLQKENLKQLR